MFSNRTSPLPSQTGKGGLNAVVAPSKGALLCVRAIGRSSGSMLKGQLKSEAPNDTTREAGVFPLHNSPVSWLGEEGPGAMALPHPTCLLKRSRTQCHRERTPGWCLEQEECALPLSSSTTAGPAGRLGQGTSAYCGRLFTSLWEKQENEGRIGFLQEFFPQETYGY